MPGGRWQTPDLRDIVAGPARYLPMHQTICTLEEFDAEIAAIGPGVPDAAGHRRLTGMALRHPIAERMKRLDPFSPAYRAAAIELYFDLRGRGGDGYRPERDEKSDGHAPPHPFAGVSPWALQDTAMVAEFLDSWAQIMRALDLPAGSNASVLEYGPGSGQLLLMLARMGLRTHGVDIDPTALAVLRAQAEAMGLDIRLEWSKFGQGFAGERFDRIVFFEAFHHALEFDELMQQLHERLNPGGRLIFCGEPIARRPEPGIPYPWGPRLDALSVFCIRRYGWMELGFTHRFFMEALRRSGWYAEVYRIPGSPRALTYVAQRLCDRPTFGSKPPRLIAPPPGLAARVIHGLWLMAGR